MAITRIILLFCTFASLSLMSSAQTCKNYKFSSKIGFNSCADLPVLQAHLHWNYNSTAETVHIAYRANQIPRGWISWGINPTGSGMVGTQALVAFQDLNGKMKVYTTQINSYSPEMKPKPLSFSVSELSAEYVNDEMIISAVLGPLSNGTTFNIVWQAGNAVSNGIPQSHPHYGPYIRSSGTLDFLSL
ncbi:cytochrome b561 and DOMON domain-containing protein At5g47530 [Beta vulgaris subsp. vulgaris]|uniref:cytochrome b561 and DOMON domain-containing protein At5g47530 n=1 Tax=Beta vulgaris subsp. vulgaris TaxID=3555 RepID=UPI002036B25A|nr:cytochrome b561 and DOMON domain-containing protein At5g47530 [Beta vulgaris subsp. vulgaris]